MASWKRLSRGWSGPRVFRTDDQEGTGTPFRERKENFLISLLILSCSLFHDYKCFVDYYMYKIFLYLFIYMILNMLLVLMILFALLFSI